MGQREGRQREFVISDGGWEMWTYCSADASTAFFKELIIVWGSGKLPVI